MTGNFRNSISSSKSRHGLFTNYKGKHAGYLPPQHLQINDMVLTGTELYPLPYRIFVFVKR